MKLSHLIKQTLPIHLNPEITGLHLDSQLVTKGSVFCAVQGGIAHGSRYIEDALARGAVAVLYEDPHTRIGTVKGSDIPCIYIDELKKHLSQYAARFYKKPNEAFTLYGITGTNGKTSVAHYLAQCLQYKTDTGVVGTLGNSIYQYRNGVGHNTHLSDTIHASHTMTTPDAISLQACFAAFKNQGAQSVVMEVSSHALDQYRVESCDFTTAIFTNLSRDHLDYHKTMLHYEVSKRRLFCFPSLKHAVVNYDDEAGRYLVEDVISKKVNVLSYGRSSEADIYVSELILTVHGKSFVMHTPEGTIPIRSQLLGHINTYNLLAVCATLLQQGHSLTDIQTWVAMIKPVAGRMEAIKKENKPTFIIDYAHTPDALENALRTLRSHCRGKVYCVFGCGGNRDKGKRKEMGAAAAHYADHVLITSDNPRHEDPALIIADIEQGMLKNTPYESILDRKAAIHAAAHHAEANDIVLIAGKGHETYQIIGDQRFYFNDKEIVTELLHDD